MWPPEALEFLRELEANNDRDWFKANRARYDDDLLAPAKALAQALAHLGEPRFFRPYNDARFQNRPPIKEQLGVAIGDGAAGVYYVELSLDGLLVGAGLHHPATDQLERFRRAIDHAGAAAAFERAVDACATAGLTLIEPTLKRAPRGYAIDHPRIDHLRRKHVTAYCRHPLGDWLHEPRATDVITTQLEAARPLVSWLGDHVGASQVARRSR